MRLTDYYSFTYASHSIIFSLMKQLSKAKVSVGVCSFTWFPRTDTKMLHSEMI